MPVCPHTSEPVCKYLYHLRWSWAETKRASHIFFYRLCFHAPPPQPLFQSSTQRWFRVLTWHTFKGCAWPFFLAFILFLTLIINFHSSNFNILWFAYYFFVLLFTLNNVNFWILSQETTNFITVNLTHDLLTQTRGVMVYLTYRVRLIILVWVLHSIYVCGPIVHQETIVVSHCNRSLWRLIGIFFNFSAY